MIEADDEGLSRTDIRNLFNKHGDAGQIEVALAELVSARVAVMTQRETAGRYAEVWKAVEPQDATKIGSGYKVRTPSVASVASVAHRSNGGAS